MVQTENKARKYNFCFQGSKNVSLNGVDDKRLIAVTFALNSTGCFLSIQLICNDKALRCLPKYDFPVNFSVSFTINYWSNTKKSIKFFYETVFPYFEKIKEEKRFPKGKHSVVIMDTIKGENNDMLKKIVLK